MLLKGILKTFDKWVCVYLGLTEEKIQLDTARVVKKRLVITNTISSKRHLLRESWDDFSCYALKQTEDNERERLGIAVGKALAKNLVISFEEPH